MCKRKRWLLVGLLATAILGVSAYALRERRLHALAPTDIRPEPFDARGWQSGSATRRIPMAQHLAARGELIGRTRAEIVARLGTPLDGATEHHLEWYLGNRESAASLMFPYQEHLAVSFDEQGVCVRAIIYNRD